MFDEYPMFGLILFNAHPFSSPPVEGRNDRASKCGFYLIMFFTRFSPRRDAGASVIKTIFPVSRPWKLLVIVAR